MTIRVTNLSSTQKTVPIVTSTGAKDEIHLQPRGRVSLPIGYNVANTYRAKENNVTVIDDAPAAIEKAAATPTGKVVNSTKN